MFIRYTDDEWPQVMPDGERLLVKVRDLALNRWLTLPADLVPMSMSVLPSSLTRLIVPTSTPPSA